MNLGLGNLTLLKNALLPDALQPDTQFDTYIKSIGAGVATSFEQFCNRKFGYVVNDTFECPANRTYVSLPRFPVVNVSAIDERDTADSDWQTLGTPEQATINIALESGLMEFGFIVAPHFARIRTTYTGGFWFETLEPGDDGYPSAMPAGASPLPADIQDAWLLQSQFLFIQRDVMGQRGIKKQDKESTGDFHIAEIPMLQYVQDILASYRRFVA